MTYGASRYPRGDLRVSDADRDQAISELSEAFQAGRLTAEEFEERSDQALRARTGNDITRLLADLPRSPARPAADPAGTGPRPVSLAAVPRILVAVPVIVALVIAAIAAGSHGHHHHYAFGVFPALFALMFVARLARGASRGGRRF